MIGEGAGTSSRYIEPLLRALRGAPTSVAVWGMDRRFVTNVSLGIAAGADPEFVWMDIRSGDPGVPSWQRGLERRLPAARLRPVVIEEMGLDDLAGNAAESVVHEDANTWGRGSAPAVVPRLPQAIRELLMAPPAAGGPRVLLMSNVERASAAFDGAAGSLRPYIEALNSAGITVITTSIGRPRENRRDLDLVLRLGRTESGGSGDRELVCECVRSAGRFPAIPPGTEYSPDRLAVIFERLPAA